MQFSPAPRLLGVLAVILAFAAATGAAEFKIDGKNFTVPDGFTVERVAGPDLAPRPIVAAFDERGRLYVADSSGSSENVQKQLAEKPHRIVRLEDSDGDGTFEKSVVFADKMMFPEGAMWLDGSLFVSAPPSIWKLTDADGDGVAEKREEWFKGKTLTGCANDLHGPYAGPDGWVYWAKGAFAEQRYTLPTGKPFVTKASHLFRARADGTGIEPVMTGGMDNPVDVVFTPGGERVFSCTFLQNPAGGKRDGLIHAVYGGVYGKVHDVIDGHPRTRPDVMPVMSHLGPAAPCGLTRYESNAFGDEFRDNLFCTLFNMRKVTRHVLTRDGASFKSRDEDFLVCDSLDFHPTDVIEDADGSLLVVDTGGWYKLCCPTSQLDKPDVLGAIYRVRRTGAAKVDDPRGLQLSWTNMPPEDAARLLGDPRPAVRERAIQTLPKLGAAALPAIEKSMSEPSPVESRLAAVWAATRIDDPKARASVRRALGDKSETVRQAAAHSVSAWRDKAALPELKRLLATDSYHNRRVTAEALGRIGDASAVTALFEALRGMPEDEALSHSLVYALIEIGDPSAVVSEGIDRGSDVARLAALVAVDQMRGSGPAAPPHFSVHVTQSLGSSDPALRRTAAWIAGRHPEWGDAVARAFSERLSAPAGSGQDPELLADLGHVIRLPPVQTMLADRLAQPASSLAQRKMILAAMGSSGAKELPAAWAKALASILADEAATDALLVSAAVTTVRRLPLGKESAAAMAGPLLRAAANDGLPASTRVEALAALPAELLSLSPDVFDLLTRQLSPARPTSVRVQAADVLGRAKLTPRQLASLAGAVETAGPLEIGRLLAAFEQSADEAVGMALVAALEQSKATRALRAEAVAPKLAKFPQKVRDAAAPLLASLSPDAGEQRRRLDEMLATLPKGDVRKGQLVFNSRQAACSTCHAIGYVGGQLGPDLTRIGQVRSDRDLLESIVFPSASFVQTYEPVLVDTNAGDRQSGILKKNDADEVVLLTGPDQETRIARKDVAEMRPSPISVMPAGLDQQLTPQDLADLVAFLKACK